MHNKNNSYWLIGLGVVALLGVVGFGFQGSRGIWQPDEGYFVVTSLTMHQRGSYLIPVMGEEIFLEKPPLTYWGIIESFRWMGPSEGSARFFHAVCFVLTGILVGILGWRVYGDPATGLASSAIYGTMALPIIACNFVTTDTPLVLMTTAAMLCFWESARTADTSRPFWMLMTGVCVGLGFLAKGPAALIPCAAMMAFLLVRRRFIRYLNSRWVIISALVFLGIGLIWYVWIFLHVPGAMGYMFDNQIWGRLASDKYQRNPGLVGSLIYLPTILLGALPWSLNWWRWISKASRNLTRIGVWRQWWTQPDTMFGLCWIAAPMTIYLLASSRLPLYVLPLFGAIAMMTGRVWIAEIRAGMAEGRKPAKTIALSLLLWVGLVSGGKALMARYPTAQDMRSLWSEIKPYLPMGRYEIITLDKPADGLYFYGATEVENVTVRENAYPRFVETETLLIELEEIVAAGYPHMILVDRPGKLPPVEAALANRGIEFDKHPLKHHRVLLVCRAQTRPNENPPAPSPDLISPEKPNARFIRR